MTAMPGAGRNLDSYRVQLLLGVVHELYASAMQGSAVIWHKIYEQCSLLLGSEAGGFVSIDKLNRAADMASVVGFDPDHAIRVYREYGIENDLLFTGTLSMSAGSSFVGTGMMSFRTQQRSPYYRELSAPLGLRFVCGGMLENDARRHSVLCFWRRARQPDFNHRSRDTLTAVIPHVRQALEVQRRVRGSQSDAVSDGPFTLTDIQSSRHGMLVLDGTGKVLFVNPEGERIFRSGNGVTLRQGCLSVDDPQAAADVERMMSRVIDITRGVGLVPMRPIRVPQAAGRHCYELLMIPVTEGAQQAVLPPTAAFIVTLTLTDASRLPGSGPQRLRAYGLTAAEARLCEVLLRIGSLPEAAELLHISRSTARSHLKSIFAKLGVSSQVQLVTRLAAAQAAAPW